MKSVVVMAGIFLSTTLSFAADADLLWQIGVCDNSYSEFACAGNLTAYQNRRPENATVEIGKDNPAEKWFFIQPGPQDKPWAGEGEHPYEIIFNLDETPHDLYLVRIDLVDTHSVFAPSLRVRVNDKIKSFHLNHGVSDASLSSPANGREQIIEMYVPAGFLHKGRNVVNLVVESGSWVLYDCITMQKAHQPPTAIENLELSPTFFFKETNGELKQILNASFDLYLNQKSVHTELISEKGWTAVQEFENLKSGPVTLEVEAPPVTEKQTVHLKLTVDSTTFETTGVIAPQKKWRIYMMPSAHFDYGYTSIQSQALALHRDNLEKAIAWTTKYPDFVWNIEGSFVADDYLQNGSRPAELIELAKRGRIGIMGFYVNELTGVCSNESLTRLIEFYDSLRHKYGIESKCAMQNDVPTMVATIPMILNEHGILYMSHGINMTRAGRGQEMHQNPFYWESPDGSRVLMWKVIGTYAQSAEITGLDDAGHLGLARDRITGLLSEFAAREDYPYDALLLHGAYGDNYPIGISLADVPNQWNKTYAYPKLIFCRGAEFFEYIEANFRQYIKTVKGDGGVYWEDGVASSARETAITRVAKEQLVTAEKLITLCSKQFQSEIASKIAEAWKNALLYDEHTWGAACSIEAPFSKDTLEQWEVKKNIADRTAQLAKEALDSALHQLAHELKPGGGLLVFNPSSWARSEWVRSSTPTGTDVELFADSVPPMGYKVFPFPKPQPAKPKPTPANFLENRFYKIQFDTSTGAVKSIYDKELKRELVDASNYGLNAYLYATLKKGGSVLNCCPPEPSIINLHPCQKPSFRKSILPGRQIMTVTCTTPNAKSFSAETILYDHSKRIDFLNHIDKELNLEKEAGYFAFPFAFKKPSIRLEIPNGVIRPETDQFPGACRDWYAVQNFLTISDDTAAVAWTAVDSPLITLQDINRGQWYTHLDIQNGNIFAYVFNNYWWTNYKAAQEGPHTFRFSITSAKSISDIEAKRFGESVMSPMVCVAVPDNPTPTKPTAHSFVQVAGNGIVLQAVKPAAFHDGTVTRLREMRGQTGTAIVNVTGIPFTRAYLSNLAEDKVAELKSSKGRISIPCRGYGLATLLLER